MSHNTQAENKSPCSGPDCCNDTESTNTASTTTASAATDTRDKVRAGYAEIAKTGQWSSVNAAPKATGCCGGSSAESSGGGGGCCGPTTLTPEQVALAVGYSDSDLSLIPGDANMGLSCGNPNALADLKPGETVLDLGSGGGFDCFIAGPKVGATGQIIGVDMTPEMISKARAGLATYSKTSGLTNVEFRLGEIENIPAPDNSIDVVISNCVINLSPDKDRVWREVARILKPGGRVAISDLALLKPLPDSVASDLEALVGCIAGAQLVDDIRASVQQAGLTDLKMTAKPQYIEAMTNWQDPLYQKIAEALPEGASMSDYVVSLDIEARKP